MNLKLTLPVLLVLGLGTGCQSFGTLGLKKSNDMSGADAVAKLEANRPAGEKLPEIVALPPAPAPAPVYTPAPPPAPGFTASTAMASSKGDGTTVSGASFDDEEIVVPRRKAPRKGGGEAAPSPSRFAKAASGVHAKTYVVQRGDTLQKISQKFYGTTKSWQKIFDANKAKMKKADVVIAGMVLTIP